MSARRLIHFFNPDDLPTMKELLRAARDPSRASSSGARSSALKQAGGGAIPGGWEAGIVEAQAKRERRTPNRNPKLPHGADGLPVATDAEMEQSNPRFCRRELCKRPLPPTARPTAQYCPDDDCAKKEQNKRYKARMRARKKAAKAG